MKGLYLLVYLVFERFTHESIVYFRIGVLILNHINVPVLASPMIDTGKTGYSVFSDVQYTVDDYNGLFITERMDALNFRHRISEPGYFSSWHVAGDPTLIIIRSGILRITLRNGDYRDFSAGDLFIAQDRLQKHC